jgi:hypothetical protein
MSPILEFITLPRVLQAYVIPLAIFGIPLLWRYLTYKPVTRHQIGHVAWMINIAGCWILFGNAAFDAYKGEMISLTKVTISEVALFATVAGGFHLVERRYPEENKS